MFALVVVAMLLVLLAKESPDVAVGIAFGLLVAAFITIGLPGMAELRKIAGVP